MRTIFYLILVLSVLLTLVALAEMVILYEQGVILW